MPFLQKTTIFKNNLKVRSGLYLSTGLVIAGLVILLIFSNVTRNYSAYSGFIYEFEWPEDQTFYTSIGAGTIPQILVGQQLEVSLQFEPNTDPGFIVHMFLVPGRLAYLIDVNGDWVLDLTPEDLVPHAVYNNSLHYDVQGTQTKVFSLQVPQDNAYTVTFLADSSAISNNLTGILVVNNYLLHGEDRGGVLVGLSLIGLGLILGLLPVFYSISPSFMLRSQTPKQKEEESRH